MKPSVTPPTNRKQSAVMRATQVIKSYSIEDLPFDLQDKLKNKDPLFFKGILLLIAQNATGTPSKELKALLSDTIDQFQKTRALFDSHEQLKNLNSTDYLNREYYKCAYSQKIGMLYYFLGDTERAQNIFHQTLLENDHPSIIVSYHFVTANSLEDPTQTLTYYKHLIKANRCFLGSKLQEQAISEAFKALSYNSTEHGLNCFIDTLYDDFIQKKEEEELSKFFSDLADYSKTSTIIKGLTRTLFLKYLDYFLKNFRYEEANQLLIKFDWLTLPQHYKLAASHASKRVNINPALTTYVISWLDKAINLGDLKSKASLAYVLLYSAEELVDDKNKNTRALKLIQEIQKQIKSSKNDEMNALRGLCYHLIGRIYDFGLLPNNPTYRQSDQLAFANYTLGAQFNHADSLQDLAIMYRDGQGTKQDLEKAAELLTRSSNLGSTEAQLELGPVRLMQASLAQSAEQRNKLIVEGIKAIESVLSNENEYHSFNKRIKSEAHHYAASLYLALDTGLDMAKDKNYQTVQLGFDTTELFDYHPNSSHQYVQLVEEHLQKSFAADAIGSAHTLAAMYHAGNYFEQNLDAAKMLYNLCIEYTHGKNLSLLIELAGLNLLFSERATNQTEKQAYLLEALQKQRFCLKVAKTSEQKEIMNQLFSKSINAYRRKVDIATHPISLHQLYGTISLSNQKDCIEKKLSKAIHELQNLLAQKKSSNETSIIKLLLEIKLILSKSKHQIPIYLDQFEALYDLQKQLLKLYVTLSTNAQMVLIKVFSQWPIINDIDGTVNHMLLLLQPKELKPTQCISLLLSISRFKHQSGLFEDDLIRIHQLLHIDEIEDISTAARLIYIIATVHANSTQQTTKDYITKQIMISCASLIHYINEYCWDSNPDDMSQIHHGINYLTQIYPEQFCNLPSNLHQFIEFSNELLKGDRMVTISNQQASVYKLLSSMDSNFIHEPLTGGRRVDFYNPKTNEVVFYHGPSHYLYSTKGQPTALTSATVLCEETLKLQNYTVIHIDYYRWTKASTEKQQIDLLKTSIPSLNNQSLTEEIKDLPEKKLAGNQSPMAFWKAFKPAAKTIEMSNQLQSLD